MPGIEQLSFTDHFVRELPGDPREDNRVRQVRGACWSKAVPTAVPQPELLALVPEVAALLGLDRVQTPALAEVLAGNRVLPGTTPYSACYGGHQFGTWAGQLGDGRAITLAEVVGAAGETWEMQLKGAGPTPYSRSADGRAVLRSSLRELVCSEAMFHLGVPTTRALSLVTTGERIVRDMFYDGHPQYEPGAVVCRVAPSFLRFGNYEIHAALGDRDTLARLVRFTIDRYFPGLDVAGFFAEVVRRTAFMVSEWMRVGFVHGVMNTDNMSILGLTIDYGPYGWLEPFDPDWTPNTTDAGGRRYRFGNQPGVAFWNLGQLARALAPLVDDLVGLEAGLKSFPDLYVGHHRAATLRKLGLADTPAAEPVLEGLLPMLLVVETDMTLFFRKLAEVPRGASPAEALGVLRDAHYAPDAMGPREEAPITDWLRQYLDVRAADDRSDEARRRDMDAVNPLYVPRNFLVQEVIDATAGGDRAALGELMDVLRRPYERQPGKDRFAAKRPEWARHRPGCSMLSCSS